MRTRLGEEPSKACLDKVQMMDSSPALLKDENFLKFCRDCIVKPYEFKISEEKTMWMKPLPDFRKEVQDWQQSFQEIAKGTEMFFLGKGTSGKIRNWNEIKDAMKKFEDGPSCENMLYIIAARQLYVTYVMKTVVGSESFKLCEEKENGDVVIPDFACYPKNSGSARCTSDYDVGLIGPKSGKVVVQYFEYFKANFKMTSDALLDNNIYAYDLEMAMPEIFVLGDNPGEDAEEHEKLLKEVKSKMLTDPDFQMQDLALAYFKVFMYKDNEESLLKKQALKYLSKDGDYAEPLKQWFENDKLEKIKAEFLKKCRSQKDEEIKECNSETYAKYVEKIANPSEKDEALLYSALSRIYASEAYLTRGAIRVVVGSQQMEKQKIKESLTALDHWTSLIENYGDMQKDYERECKKRMMNMYACLLKLSKYMWRAFESMNTLLNVLEKEKITSHADDNDFYTPMNEGTKAIERFSSAKPSPVQIANNWVKCFKDKGKSQIEKEYSDKECPEVKLGSLSKKNWAMYFLKDILDCSPNSPVLLKQVCVDKISYLVRAVNQRMLKLADKKRIVVKV